MEHMARLAVHGVDKSSLHTSCGMVWPAGEGRIAFRVQKLRSA